MRVETIVRHWRCEGCGATHRAGERGNVYIRIGGTRALRCVKCDGRMIKVNPTEGVRDWQHGPPVGAS
jgi:hypothetical protein